MATSTSTETCPYLIGDPIQVEHEGQWLQGRVIARARHESRRFGLIWDISVHSDELPHVVLDVACDGDGRNHTINRAVRPGFEEVA